MIRTMWIPKDTWQQICTQLHPFKASLLKPNELKWNFSPFRKMYKNKKEKLLKWMCVKSLQQLCHSNNHSKKFNSMSKCENTSVVMEMFSQIAEWKTNIELRWVKQGCQDSQPRLGRWSQAQQPAFHLRRREWCFPQAECLCTEPWECSEHGPAAQSHTPNSV